MSASIWNFDSIICISDIRDKYRYCGTIIPVSIMKYYHDSKIYNNGYIPLTDSRSLAIFYTTTDGVSLKLVEVTNTALMKIIGIKYN